MPFSSLPPTALHLLSPTYNMEKRINSSVRDAAKEYHNLTNGFLNDLTDKDIGFSWPPRSYTCSFCKREFRSAQALGGHMNVHRRDRARLKQMSSSSSTQQYFSTSLFNGGLHHPNPNFSPHFSSKMLLSPSSVQHDSSTAHDGENLTMMKYSHNTPGLGFCKFHGLPCQHERYKMPKNPEIIVGESKSDDDLDLELRLGCS